MFALRIIGIGIALSFFGSSANSSHWRPVSNPSRLLYPLNSTTSFRELPLSGAVPQERTPWINSVWSLRRGGIAYRWNGGHHLRQTFYSDSPTQSEALRMNPEQVARLSPSEKYDLFLGRYDYPLTRSEFEHTSSNDRHWEGYCHGTAPASINLIEPAPITMMNPDGVIVPFGSSDIKALLSYYYGKYFPYVRKIGSECRRRGNRRGSGSCAEDVNAGAFHIVMTHLLGRRHQAFIIDVATGLEIWNKAVFEFSSSIISESSEIPLDSAFGTTRRVKIETVISYGDNRRDQLSWDPTVGTPQYLKTQRTYQYWLELDGRDQIIGGEWISTEKPDAVWIKDRISFTGEFEALNQIYQPAR